MDQIEAEWWAHHYFENPTTSSDEDDDFNAEEIMDLMESGEWEEITWEGMNKHGN